MADDKYIDEHELPFRFAAAMAAQLDSNHRRGKRGWGDLTPAECIERAREELAELEAAIARRESITRVTAEAADVANFLAFLMANYRAAHYEDGRPANVCT